MCVRSSHPALHRAQLLVPNACRKHEGVKGTHYGWYMHICLQLLVPPACTVAHEGGYQGLRRPETAFDI
jgi:hypothetical protein